MIGIVGYGVYIPRYRIKTEEIARVWGKNVNEIKNSLGVEEKSVPDIDEDTITISVEAAKNAILSANIESSEIGAVYIGSESHPYVVKPSGTVVVDALNIGPDVMVVDMEFACKAGTAAIQCCYSHVRAGLIKYGLAIGADTSQGMPGDPLEYTAAAGGGAYIIGNQPIAEILDTYSYTTDTPDFWRREGQEYPRHGARFTGKPAYFHHILNATKTIMEKNGLTSKDIDYVVFHMPNAKFPQTVAKQLGFKKEQYEPGLVVRQIGNCYSASSLIGLAAVLDIVKPKDVVLLASYGSGAGSDSFIFEITDRIEKIKNRTTPVSKFINQKKYVDYGMYVRLRKKLKR